MSLRFLLLVLNLYPCGCMISLVNNGKDNHEFVLVLSAGSCVSEPKVAIRDLVFESDNDYS